VTADSAASAAGSLHDLQVALEELRVAKEELRAQNEELVRIQSHLRDEHERYLQLFEHAPDGYLVTDRNGVILEANQAMVGLLKHRREHLMGKPVAIFIPEKNRNAFHARINRLLREARVQDWETTLLPHHSTEVPVLVRVNPMLDAAGEAIGLRWLVRDVTARKLADVALWNERNFISAILDTTAALMVVLDADGRIVRFNHACELITGYSQEEIQGTLMWEKLLVPEEIDVVQNTFRTLLARKSPSEHENYWLAKDGRKNLIRWSNTVLKDNHGDVKYAVATGIDITAQRTAEEKTRQQQEMLAHSMRVSTMGEMASGLAHEINQPLAAIINYAQGCLQRLDGDPVNPAALREAIRQISLQAQRAADIVQHLRNFVSKGMSQRVTIDIKNLVSETIKLAVPEASNIGTTLHLDLPALPPVRGDDIQIQQVLLNLLRNSIDAISQCPPENHLIAIRAFLNGDHHIEVIVSDSGTGITQEALDKAFDPFYTTKKNGMGLGLAISRTIIEDHGGRLWVARNPDQGTSFHFTLPLKSQDHAD
jgi:PAS domain S-box-containing protein